jgi:hypothetical protein
MMIDYYPLIARAVADLAKNTGDQRRAIYERARTALVDQLRGLDPPLTESEITRERLALEESIRMVEAEAARKAHIDLPRFDPATVTRPLDLFKREEEPPPITDEGLKGFRDVVAEAEALAEASDQAARSARQAFAAVPPDDPARAAQEEGGRLAEELRRQSEEERRRAAAEREREVREAERLAEEIRRLREEEERKIGEAQRELEDARQRAEEIRRSREAEGTERAEPQHEQEAKRRIVRAKLAEAASPAPSVAPDGRLDAGPNAAYDVPTVDSDLPSLPIRQRALIKTILSDLPRNAPAYLKTTLDNYDDELRTRGVQPLLGLLKDMTAIIEATIGAPDAAREWLSDGMQTAFDRFAQNHALFVKHFPLDPKREELYAYTDVDESNATGSVLSRPFQEVASAALEANEAGLTTDDFLKIVDKMAEFAKIIASLPPQAPAHPTSSNNDAAQPALPPFPIVHPEDRVPVLAPVSPKKRMLLSGLGFFERAYNLLGSTASLIGLPEGRALLGALNDAIAGLLKLVSP